MDPNHEMRKDKKERRKIYEFIVELFRVVFISVRLWMKSLVELY